MGKRVHVKLLEPPKELIPVGIFYMGHHGHLASACQTLREIFALTDDPVIQLKCRIATRQCKMMAGELSLHDPTWERRLWPPKDVLVVLDEVVLEEDVEGLE
jgi:hypothetical protein